MIHRMPSALTAISHASSRSTVTRTGHPSEAACRRMSSRMAGLDGLAQTADVAVEGFVLCHGNMPRSREIDGELVDDRCRAATHDEHAVRQERRFADAVGDENDRLPVGLPD